MSRAELRAEAPPERSEARTALAGAPGPSENASRLDSDPSAWPDAMASERERVEAIDRRANHLLGGFRRHEWAAQIVGDRTLLVGKWGRWREVSFDEAEALLARLGGRHAG